MKKCELQNAWKETMQIPAAAFALGVLCGLAVGALLAPISKGIVIGSNNGSHNRESHEEEITAPNE